MAANMTPYLFPVKGLHTAVGYDVSPPGTTPDALNVVGYDTLKNRLRGGRRAGLSKYCTQQINGSAIIQAMAKTVQGTAYQSTNPDTGAQTTVDETYPGTLTQNFPTFLGNNWTFVDRNSTTFEGDAAANWGASANGLVLDHPRNGRPHAALACLRYRGTNNVAVYMQAAPKISSVNGGAGGIDEAGSMGPFIRADGNFGALIYAALIRNGADATAQLKIISRAANNTESVLAASSNITLGGGAGVLGNFKISLQEDILGTDNLTARVVWPGAGSAGANIDVTVQVNNSTNNQNRRCGFGVYNINGSTSWTTGVTAGSRFRTFTRVVTAYITPNDPLPAHTISATDKLLNQYLIPSGTTAFRVDTTGAGSNTKVVGPYDSNSTPTNVPYLDTVNDTFIGNASGNVREAFFRTTPDAANTDVEFNLKLTTLTTVHNPRFLMRFDLTAGTGVVVEFTLNNASSYTTTYCTTVTSIKFEKWQGNKLISTYSTFTTPVPIHQLTTVRCVDDGASLTVYFDGAATGATQGTSDFVSNRLVVGVGPTTFTATSPSPVSQIVWRPQASTAADAPIAATSTSVILAVAGGNVYGLQAGNVNPAINGTAALTSERFQVQMVSGYNRTFMFDGVRSKVYNLADNTVTDYVATAGTVPPGCRLACLYRGRIVLSGASADPQNWYMSKSGDPFNFDYSPTIPNANQAVAGNNSQAGLVGDVVTALIPVQDDVMFFGGDHTIYKMTGDPAAGGTIDLVSDQTGIAFGKAWAKDPENMIYFWGQSGVYKMAPDGSPPVCITRGVLGQHFETLNKNRNVVRLEWDFFHHGLMVAVVNVDNNFVNPVFFFDARAEAWWRFAYPSTVGPNCMLAFDGEQPNDQVFLFGCRDGYIRKIDETAVDDDGVDITSRVRWPVMVSENHASEVILTDVLPVLSSTSASNVRLDVYTGQTAEDCVLAASPRVRKLLTHAGRNSSLRHKVRGYAVQIALSQTGKGIWAIESLSVGFDPSGRPRREKSS